MIQIPNQFHFVFGLKEQNEPFHIMYYVCLKSCIEVNKPEKIYFYYRFEPYGDYWELIKPHLELIKVSDVDFLKNYNHHNNTSKTYNYAHHADYIRVDELIKQGGIYADMDTLFVNKLPDYLFNKPFVLGREPDIWSESSGKMEKTLCNAFIMSKKGASFGKRWLKEMPVHYDGSWSNHSTILPQKLSEKHPDEIHIEPQRSFYHFSWKQDDIHSLFLDNSKVKDDIYSIHLWNHLWFSRLKRNITTFHGGQLTRQYIQSGKTTYAKLARSFLPDEEELNNIKLSVTRVQRLVKKSKSIQNDIRFFGNLAADKIQIELKKLLNDWR